MKKYSLVKKVQILAWVLFMITNIAQAADNTRFAIISDLHAQDMPDGKKRLTTFLNEAKREQVDFIIELGDFCRLDDVSKPFRTLWNAFPGSKYHAIGNHDMDKYTPEEYVKGMQMPHRYYSFDQGDFHFIEQFQ